MPVGRTLFSGSPYLGVYLRAGDRGVLVPQSAPMAVAREVERLLGVPTFRCTVQDSEILGALVAMNSHGAVVGDEIDIQERAAVEQLAPVTVVRARHNAMGNNVLANDRGAIVHPDLGDEAVARIGTALGVEARRGTVAGLGTVGMAAVATNRGAVIHPRATEKEAQAVEEALQVKVHRSTANFGVPIVGACLIANGRAILTGRPTTTVEIVHLQEGLQVFD